MKITLKTNVSSTLETDETSKQQHTNYIGFIPEVAAQLGKTVNARILSSDDITAGSIEEIETFKYLADTELVFVLADDSLVHSAWVAKVENEAINKSIDTSAAYINLTKSFMYSKSEKALVDKSSIKLCLECGSPLDTTHSTLCTECLTKKHFHVHNYSYTPNYNFHGKQTGKHAKQFPTWYGIELEFGLESKLPMALLHSAHESELYLKSDASIDGGNYRAELVSHPSSFQHLTSADSWVSKLDTLDAKDKPDKNGCHIHISRTAFKDNKHYAKFKFLIQENIDLLEKIGGRKLNNYCNILANKHTMFKTTKDNAGGDKYTVCNEQHKDTIELRFMASSNKPEQVKRYLEFIDSIIKYTAYYATSASYEGYYKYVTKYQASYPNIHKLLTTNESLLKGVVKYKEPKYLTADIKDLTAKYYGAITTLQFFNVPEITNGTTKKVTGNTFKIEVNNNTGCIKSICDYALNPNSKVLATYAKI